MCDPCGRPGAALGPFPLPQVHGVRRGGDRLSLDGRQCLRIDGARLGLPRSLGVLEDACRVGDHGLRVRSDRRGLRVGDDGEVRLSGRMVAISVQLAVSDRRDGGHRPVRLDAASGLRIPTRLALCTPSMIRVQWAGWAPPAIWE